MQKMLIILASFFLNKTCYKTQVQILDGKWKIETTGILLTSMENEKETFYNNCINKVVNIKKSELNFDLNSCFEFINAKKIIIGSHFIKNSKDLPILNFKRLFASLSILKSPPKRIEGFNIRLITFDNRKVNAVLLILSSKKIVIVSDPIFISLTKMSQE